MRKLAPTLLLIIGLAACASPQMPEDHYYRLDLGAQTAAPGAAPLVASINVQRIAMTGIYGERPLLYSSTRTPTQLRQYHYHYWADSPANLIQGQLVDYLRAAHLARDVSAGSNGVAADYQLTGTVQRFEQRLDGTGAHAHVMLELSVQRTKDGERLFNASYRADVPTRDSSPLAAAQGLSQALAECFAAFSADVRRSGLH